MQYSRRAWQSLCQLQLCTNHSGSTAAGLVAFIIIMLAWLQDTACMFVLVHEQKADQCSLTAAACMVQGPVHAHVGGY